MYCPNKPRFRNNRNGNPPKPDKGLSLQTRRHCLAAFKTLYGFWKVLRGEDGYFPGRTGSSGSSEKGKSLARFRSVGNGCVLFGYRLDDGEPGTNAYLKAYLRLYAFRKVPEATFVAFPRAVMKYTSEKVSRFRVFRAGRFRPSNRMISGINGNSGFEFEHSSRAFE